MTQTRFPNLNPWNSEELDIDVETVKKIDAFCSSDEEAESTDFLFLPITPEVDDPEESPHLPPRDPTSEMGAQSEDHQTPDEKLKSGKRSKTTKKSAKRQKLRWWHLFLHKTAHFHSNVKQRSKLAAAVFREYLYF